MTMLDLSSSAFVPSLAAPPSTASSAASSAAPTSVARRSDAAADPTADAEVCAEPAAIPLSDLVVGGFATIHAVLPTDNDADRDLVLRMIEIGFVPGERVRVIAVGHPGRQPIAVRLAATDSGRRNMSGSTFAMRRHEADFIRVVPDLPLRPRGRAAASDHE